MNSFKAFSTCFKNHLPEKVVQKLYSNQILWKDPFPLPGLGVMNIVHIFHLTGPNKVYLDFFLIFTIARVGCCLHMCIGYLYFFFHELHVHVLFTCLEYQPFVHFIFKVYSQVCCLLIDFFISFWGYKPNL